MGRRETFVDLLRSAVGSPYMWGGQSPETGFDCSGLVVWGLREAGWVIGDRDSAGLAREFHHNKKLIGLAEPGDLLFYGKTADAITHVMVVLLVWTRHTGDRPDMVLIGARGGDASISNRHHAYRRNAMVDVVRGTYWLSGYQFIRGID